MGSRCTAWLLCLLIALLPLRGLAHGWMATGAGLQGLGVTLVVTEAAPAQLALLPPCHQAEQATGGVDHAVPAGAAASDGKTVGHGCGQCDLCHSPLARAAEPVWALSAPPCAGPIALLQDPAPDAPGAGIFRPPRG